MATPAPPADAPLDAPAGLGFKHPRVQRLRRLVRDADHRRRERVFVVEGMTAVADALAAGVALETVFAAPDAPAGVLADAETAGIAVERLASGVLDRVGDTVTTQGVAAVAPFVDVPLDALSAATLVVVCVDVRDPGNAGTVIRSAEAAGADGIVCCDGSVDVFNPKTVRATAGSLFHIRVVSGGDPVEVLEQLGQWGLRRMGAEARGGTPYDRADLRDRVAFVIGNEARGLPPAVAPHIDEPVTIPIVGRAESLNAGVAASLLCFEAARQRRAAGPGAGSSP